MPTWGFRPPCSTARSRPRSSATSCAPPRRARSACCTFRPSAWRGRTPSPGCNKFRWPSSPSTKLTASPNGATSSGRNTASSARCASTFPTSRSPPSPPAPRAACGTTSWNSSSFATRTSTSPASTAPTCATWCTSARRSTHRSCCWRPCAPTRARASSFTRPPSPRWSRPWTFWRDQRIAAVPYHGQMETAARRRNQERWMNDEVRVLVGTIAFGLGINKPAVRAVIHTRCRNRSSSITRRRAAPGRDGLPADCVLLWQPKDAGLLAYFIDQLQDPAREGARLAALPRHPQFRGERPLPPLADLHALRPDAQVAALRDVRRLRQCARVGQRARRGAAGGQEEAQEDGSGAAAPNRSLEPRPVPAARPAPPPPPAPPAAPTASCMEYLQGMAPPHRAAQPPSRLTSCSAMPRSTTSAASSPRTCANCSA